MKSTGTPINPTRLFSNRSVVASFSNEVRPPTSFSAFVAFRWQLLIHVGGVLFHETKGLGTKMIVSTYHACISVLRQTNVDLIGEQDNIAEILAALQLRLQVKDKCDMVRRR